ncbi:MAG TPA: hypothetical protein VK211_26805, partial [Kamptonema sp.]|nr:hypothetical protein [Kamptonema sp.]
LTQLQNHGGYSPEEAQKKIANDLVVEASSNPTAIKKLKDWGHTLSDTGASRFCKNKILNCKFAIEVGTTQL